MENFLEKMPPEPHFPTFELYKHKEDGFVYCDLIGGPTFWKKFGNNFQARQDDVYVASYPRSGTTWASELMWLITHDFDYETATKVSLRERVPRLHNHYIREDAFDIPSPRCFRTHLYVHLPKSITEENCKIVYSLRNPKDTLVSVYNMILNLKDSVIPFDGDFDSIFELFMKESLMMDPYWKHILQYWEQRNRENILILTYEERIKDFPASIRKLAKFLGKDLTDERVKSLAEFCSFISMRSNPSVNLGEVMSNYIRKGEIGEWKNYFSEDQNKKMDEYVAKHFSGSGLEFLYE